MAWYTPGYLAHTLPELKLRNEAQVKILREDLSIQTGKHGSDVYDTDVIINNLALEVALFCSNLDYKTNF